jgi:F-type H+-transporting ATPase subunit delta
MKVPKQARQQAKRLFRICVRDGLLDENRFRQMMAWLLEARPRGYLPILVQLQRMVQLEQDRRSAVIESPLPLDPAVQANIKSSLQRRYGPGLSFRFTQQPNLLAGLRVQVGSDVYDGSVRARLNSVQQSFESE